METIAGFPFTGIEFTKDGAVAKNAQVQAALSMLDEQHATDVLVLSHGWNNDMVDARELYTNLLRRIRASLDAHKVSGADRAYAVIGVFWPSKKFAEKNLIPSGAAALGSAVTDAVLVEQLDDLKGVFSAEHADAALEQAKQLVPSLEGSPAARREFADLVRSVVPPSAADDEDATTAFFKLSGDQLMAQLSKPVLPPVPPPGQRGGAARLGSPQPPGGAAGLGQLVAGVKAAARNLLDFTTYYQMKERAGVIGMGGVYQVLQRIKAAHPDVRLHLAGHSFGGRLVTAAATGPGGQPPVQVSTVTLLQAAYSHYGLAEHYEGNKNGLFRRMLTDGNVSGPVLITHSVNDKAVGLAYPLASLIAGQVGAGIGDKNDRYGGLGRNGAQKTPEASDGTLLDDAHAYAFAARKIYNLNGDEIIMGHSDICKDQVADAMLTAIATT
jgi:hypothetical protein